MFATGVIYPRWEGIFPINNTEWKITVQET